jgi:hypothetical protein
MGRRTEAFVRPVTMTEGRPNPALRLGRLLKDPPCDHQRGVFLIVARDYGREGPSRAETASRFEDVRRPTELMCADTGLSLPSIISP